jgi:nucleoside 2-deoxyribosyltransferase
MKSVVVCGSKRYAAEIDKFCKELKRLGVLVFEPNFKEPMPEDIEFSSANIKHTVFKGLTLEHFDWIRKSEVCFIFNKDDYVGVSVSMEMAYATALGKPVFALSDETGDPARNSLIDKVVKTPQNLANLL